MLLQQAGITKQDQQANPQAVIDIIGFYSENTAGKSDQLVWSKFSNMKTPSPRSSPPTSPKSGVHSSTATTTSSAAATAAKRPPVPQRPAHTLTIYSTDVRPPEKTVPPPKPASKELLLRTEKEFFVLIQLNHLPPPTGSLELLNDKKEAPASTATTTNGLTRNQGDANTDLTQISPGSSPKSSRKPPAPPKPQNIDLVQPSSTATSNPASSENPNFVDTSAAAAPEVQVRPRTKPVTTMDDVIDRLKAVCNQADPTRLYRNLIKIGQG